MKEVIVCTLTTTRTGYYYYYCVLLRAEPSSTQTEQMDLRFGFRPIVFKVAYFLADFFTLIPTLKHLPKKVLKLVIMIFG